MVFPQGDPNDINNQINQSKNDLKDWTNTFPREAPSQVASRINFLVNKQEKHVAGDLKPVDLPSD